MQDGASSIIAKADFVKVDFTAELAGDDRIRFIFNFQLFAQDFIDAMCTDIGFGQFARQLDRITDRFVHAFDIAQQQEQTSPGVIWLLSANHAP